MNKNVTLFRRYDASIYESLRPSVEASDGIKGCMQTDAKPSSLENVGMIFADTVSQVTSEVPSLTPPSNMQSMSLDELQESSQSAMTDMRGLISLMGSAQGQEDLNMVSGLGQELSVVLKCEQASQEDIWWLGNQGGSQMYA